MAGEYSVRIIRASGSIREYDHLGSAKTVRQSKLGKRALRLVEKDGSFFGLSDGKICAEGENPDDVWRQLHDDAGKSDPNYFGFSGARSRFLKFFPNGFHSDGYSSQERDYKIAAKRKLETSAPLEDAISGDGFGEAILSVFRSTNLLSPFEKTRLQDVLRGKNADEFVQAAANFTKDHTKTALMRLNRVLRPHDSAKWTVVTYLPFLWRPEEHMFLKPEVTKDFATRVGHPFASLYEPALNIDVYNSLLEMSDSTDRELSDLSPRDRIDIQSFIWVVGSYKEDQAEVYS